MILPSVWIHAGVAAVSLIWTVLVLGVGRDRASLVAAATCALTAVWAGLVAFNPGLPFEGKAGVAEILRTISWGVLLGLLCWRTGGERIVPLLRGLALAGGLVALFALVLLLPGAGTLTLPTLGSPSLLARLGLALVVVLLAENLYRNADEATRWHVNLPAIALGSLAAFDILVYADAALSGAFSVSLIDARAALAALAMPLLAVAAVRDRRLRRDPPVSRDVVFYGATLVVAGAFLLGVGAVGEALRHVGTGWSRAAQASLLAGALMALAIALASRTFRSQLRRQVVDHFFTARYDYRREWLSCVATLSATDTTTSAMVRALRAIADPLDSPAGVLLLRDAPGAPLAWAGCWNRPAEPVALSANHPLLSLLRDGNWIAELSAATPEDLARAYGPLWLAVPLQHHRDGLVGIALLAPPRVPFALDGEVFDLLRTLGCEVAMFLAERRAAERLADGRRLQDYAQRFAFVAHDVKTVASQLRMVLANAIDNIDDPEFQQDMLLTVRASADRIDTLLTRLRQPGDVPISGPANVPLAQLRRIAAARRPPVAVEVEVEEEGATGLAAIAPERFEAAVTHLLNNAVEASPPGATVGIRVRQGDGGHIIVDIVDQGPGMTPEFIRDELFRPLSSSKASGSGIGAWQARELVREAGGDLIVLSRPGHGTTMRLVLPAVSEPAAIAEPLA